MKNKLLSVFFMSVFSVYSASAATVVATVNGVPITDTDITTRTKLMARQGKIATDNRRQALQNIIDDHVKLKYASNFGVSPTDQDAEKELKRLKMSGLSNSEKTMAISAIKSDIAWQVIVARTILPTINITDEQINAERVSLEQEHGLPLKLTIVRLTDIPTDLESKLSTPKNCNHAVEIAEKLGGVPQKFTAMEYELSADIRERVAILPILKWSKKIDDSVLLVCEKSKTQEYGNLDEIIKQNAIHKQAMFVAEQQLKQLRRKAVIVINDNRYKL